MKTGAESEGDAMSGQAEHWSHPSRWHELVERNEQRIRAEALEEAAEMVEDLGYDDWSPQAIAKRIRELKTKPFTEEGK